MARWAGTVSSSSAAGLESTAVGELRQPFSETLVEPNAPRLHQTAAATDVTALVIDWIRMIASSCMGPAVSGRHAGRDRLYLITPAAPPRRVRYLPQHDE